jgi:hypothetical protein
MKIEIKPAQETQLQEIMKALRLTKQEAIVHCFLVGLEVEKEKVREK